MATEEIVKEERGSYELTDLQNNPSALATVVKAEIDTQISTAHAYPRSLSRFNKNALAMVTMNKEIADECFYVIPRGGKAIEGPSIRLAEIVAAAYGNLRYGARVVGEEAENVIAQGVCHDLENNLAVTMETKRRIVDSRGNRYNSDMVTVTGNAACSIAARNAIFRVVPKILWLPAYEEARRLAKGDAKTFEVKREAVLVGFEKIGVQRKKIFDYLKIDGVQDLNSDHLITLIGIGNAIKNGEASIADLEPEPAMPRRTSETHEKSATTETAQEKTQEKAQENGGMFSGEADPYLTPAEIKEWWDKVFAADWKKADATDFLKREFKVDNPKDLRRSQAKTALEKMAKAKK